MLLGVDHLKQILAVIAKAMAKEWFYVVFIQALRSLIARMCLPERERTSTPTRSPFFVNSPKCPKTETG